VVTCEGDYYHLAFLSLFAFSKPQVTGDVSPGPYLPKQKEPSHRGDSGWDWFSYASLTSFHQSIILTTNCAITGKKTQQNFLNINSQYNAKRSYAKTESPLPRYAPLSLSFAGNRSELVSQTEQVSCVQMRR
jgi:hypothetical protein